MAGACAAPVPMGVIAALRAAVAIAVRALRDEHLDVARGDRAAAHTAHAQPVRDPEPVEVRLELAAREPQVEERAEEHVAGDPREAIEVQHAAAPRARAG